MRRLALPDEILMKVEKPARYIGGEYNSVMKDKDKVDVRVCMCFPDVYEIGRTSEDQKRAWPLRKPSSSQSL